MPEPTHADSSPPQPLFLTTRWSIVLSARDRASSSGTLALASLCRAYWYPLYVFVRRQGHGAHDAQDLTQAFFARLLEKDYLQSVEREKGRFRTFLIMAMKRFLLNEWDKLRTQKRGGDFLHLPLDTELAERGEVSYREIASALQMTEGAARVALHRLRKRFREIFREEIASTVSTSDEVDDEVRYVVGILSRD